MSNIQINPYAFGVAGTGAWKELDRNILTVDNSSIDVSSIPYSQYYMIIRHTLGRDGSLSNNGGYELNADTGNNYAVRRILLGTTGSTDVSQPDISLWDTGNQQNFAIEYLTNLQNYEKVFHARQINQGTGGSSTVPYNISITGKWANTSDLVNQITLKTKGAEKWLTGSEVIVLGYDSSLTHADSDNFWQELASVDLSGGTADVLSTGTFAAKNYLWVQCYLELSGSNISGTINFNGDYSSLYSFVRSNNSTATGGGSINQTTIDVRGGEAKNRFETMYIENKSGKEKLLTLNGAYATAGASTDVDTTEAGVKWDNAAQITEINYTQGEATGSYGTNSFIKVWGHD